MNEAYLDVLRFSVVEIWGFTVAWWEVGSDSYNLDLHLNSRKGSEVLRHAIWVLGIKVLPGYAILCFACMRDQAHKSISSDSESM